MTDIDKTLAERGARYGKFSDHARIAQDIKRAMQYPLEGWDRLADDQKQALETIADKIARILNGDPNYLDNWHDIIGYAKLVETRLIDEEGEAEFQRHAAPPPATWIRNEGSCPVPRDTLIDVQYRDGERQFGVRALHDYRGEDRKGRTAVHWYLYDSGTAIEFWRHSVSTSPSDIQAK